MFSSLELYVISWCNLFWVGEVEYWYLGNLFGKLIKEEPEEQ
jgi:hypothetical protein